MSDLNQCNFIGRLGADPEIKSFQNGGRICNLRIATSESWKDKQSGERKERTEWISVTIQSDGLVGVAERFLRKGSRVFISGKFRTRKWQDQSGQDRFSTEIVLGGYDAKLIMLDGKQDGGQQRDTGGSASSGRSGGGGDGWTGGANNNFATDDLDDEIPFATNRSIW